MMIVMPNTSRPTAHMIRFFLKRQVSFCTADRDRNSVASSPEPTVFTGSRSLTIPPSGVGNTMGRAGPLAGWGNMVPELGGENGVCGPTPPPRGLAAASAAGPGGNNDSTPPGGAAVDWGPVIGSRAAPGGATPGAGIPPPKCVGDESGTSGRPGAVGIGAPGIRCSTSPGRGPVGAPGVAGPDGTRGAVKGSCVPPSPRA